MLLCSWIFVSHKCPKQVYLIQAADGCFWSPWSLLLVQRSSRASQRQTKTCAQHKSPLPSVPRTTEQQQRFHDICGNLVKTKRRVVGWWKRLCALKEEKPKMVNENQEMIISLCPLAQKAGHGYFHGAAPCPTREAHEEDQRSAASGSFYS